MTEAISRSAASAQKFLRRRGFLMVQHRFFIVVFVIDIVKDAGVTEIQCVLHDAVGTRLNSIRPREYDGSHITFGGISPEIQLRPHQVNAIAHILYGGNTLLAHKVGAGKTFEMVAAAQESKRLGLCQKSQ